MVLVLLDFYGWFLEVFCCSYWFFVVLGGSLWLLVVFVVVLGDTFNSLGAPQPQVISSFQTELPCSKTLGCTMCKRNSIIAADTLISQSDDTVI